MEQRWKQATELALGMDWELASALPSGREWEPVLAEELEFASDLASGLVTVQEWEPALGRAWKPAAASDEEDLVSQALKSQSWSVCNKRR